MSQKDLFKFMQLFFRNLIFSHFKYDFIIITQVPAFYKINLFNAISNNKSILVLFLGENSYSRTPDFVEGEKFFHYIYLSFRNFENRNLFLSLLKLSIIIINIDYKLLGVGGWDLPEAWIASFLSPKKANFIMQESSIYESKLTFFKKLLKKIFVKNISTAFVSGQPHYDLMKSVGFKGKIFITGGVGIPNRLPIPSVDIEKKVFSGRFLYVGRLSVEKNLKMLIDAFGQSKFSNLNLSIVGDGPDYKYLKSLSSQNITFVNHIANSSIGLIYRDSDILILPSISEPWGLVVDEALRHGLPVLVSSKVGSSIDLVVNNDAGLIFDPLSIDSLSKQINLIVKNFDCYQNAVRSINFSMRDACQVSCYVDAVESLYI